MKWKYESECESVLYGNGDESFWDYFSVTDCEGSEVAKVEFEPHAKLIAAAPDLLEALREILQIGEVYHSSIEAKHPLHDFESWKMKADAAINKALGE